MSYQLNEEEQLILATVKKFLDKEVAPVASELEHANEYPTEIVEGTTEVMTPQATPLGTRPVRNTDSME